MTALLRQAVKETLAYSRHFGLPLTPEKLHRWLITPRPVAISRLKPLFRPLSPRQKKIITARNQITQNKLIRAQRTARLLSLFPTIKLVCATGSLAVDNAQKDDDLDLMIVASADTLWLTRPLVILFLKALGLRRPTSLPEHRSPIVADKVCDNLWLDETALALPKNKRNLYTAHEVLQAKPLFDRGEVSTRFIRANSWTSKYLANAFQLAINGAGVSKKARTSGPRPPTGGWDLSMIFDTPSRWLSALNMLAFKLQYSYMKRKITRETITLHSAYFHPHNPAPR